MRLKSGPNHQERDFNQLQYFNLDDIIIFALIQKDRKYSIPRYDKKICLEILNENVNQFAIFELQFSGTYLEL